MCVYTKDWGKFSKTVEFNFATHDRSLWRLYTFVEQLYKVLYLSNLAKSPSYLSREKNTSQRAAYRFRFVPTTIDDN